MSGGQFGVPLVIRMATGAGRQLAAQHSHSLEGWYAHIPGIKVLAPATLEDARGMLWTALEDPDPVLIFENVMLYNMTRQARRQRRAGRHRQGRDPARGQRHLADHLWRVAVQDAGRGDELANEGIEAEVVDLRSLRPLDDATIMASVQQDPPRLIVDEGWRTGSLAAEIGMRIAEQTTSSISTRRSAACAAKRCRSPIRASRGGSDPASRQDRRRRKAALGGR